jgi:uncharacterized protein YbjT (DUF2867 family)
MSLMRAMPPRIGRIYDLTGSESADLDHYARVFSEALGRPIRYRDVPLPAWRESLRQARFPEHLVRHLSAMAELTKQGRYDRMTDTIRRDRHSEIDAPATFDGAVHRGHVRQVALYDLCAEAP